jgi:hypothetical protein
MIRPEGSSKVNRYRVPATARASATTAPAVVRAYRLAGRSDVASGAIRRADTSSSIAVAAVRNASRTPALSADV